MHHNCLPPGSALLARTSLFGSQDTDPVLFGLFEAPPPPPPPPPPPTCLVMSLSLEPHVCVVLHPFLMYIAKSFVVAPGGSLLGFGLIPVCHNLPIWRKKMRNILMKKTMATSIPMRNVTSMSQTNKKLTPQQHSQPMTLFHRQENTMSTMTNTLRMSQRIN